MNTRKMVLFGILLALCIIGANIKILGSIALDSFPAFFGALLLGPVAGAFLGVLGHLVSAILAGFPLSLPIHIVVAVMMALTMYVFGTIYLKLISSGRWVAISAAVIGGYICNVLIDLLAVYPFVGSVVFILFWPLSVATIINMGMSILVFEKAPQYILARHMDHKVR